MVELTPVSAGSTVDAVLDQLQATVRSGAWAVGQRIPGELELTRQLRVSRPAVREAIRALTHIGVLEVRRGDGTYVRSAADPRPLLQRMQRCDVRDVFEVQLAYDVQAAKLAARRRTEADIARLHTLLEARNSATGAAEFGDTDAEFHLAIIEITRNPVLVEAARFFAAQLRQALGAVRRDHEVPEAGPAAHRAVVDAIAAGDAEAAGRAAAAVVEPTLAVLDSLAEAENTGAAVDPAMPHRATRTANARAPRAKAGADTDTPNTPEVRIRSTPEGTSDSRRQPGSRSPESPAAHDRKSAR